MRRPFVVANPKGLKQSSKSSDACDFLWIYSLRSQ